MAIKTKIIPLANVAAADDAIVYLTVITGNAQIGGSLVKFSDESNDLIKGDVKNLKLGTGSDLRGRTLEVTTNVLDVNPGTNNIVITHRFEGATPREIVNSDSVDSDGDIFSFVTSYLFQ